MDILEIYCDGGCRGNGHINNVGGWGVVARYKGHERKFKGSMKNTTNNIMELTACIEALKRITKKDIPILITTDSKYVCDGVNEWSISWKRNGWRNSRGKEVENKTLWMTLLQLMEGFEAIQIIHCRGHGSNEGNLLADLLANKAMDEFRN